MAPLDQECQHQQARRGFPVDRRCSVDQPGKEEEKNFLGAFLGGRGASLPVESLQVGLHRQLQQTQRRASHDSGRCRSI